MEWCVCVCVCVCTYVRVCMCSSKAYLTRMVYNLKHIPRQLVCGSYLSKIITSSRSPLADISINRDGASESNLCVKLHTSSPRGSRCPATPSHYSCQPWTGKTASVQSLSLAAVSFLTLWPRPIRQNHTYFGCLATILGGTMVESQNSAGRLLPNIY